jgi:hypothetical protein
VHQTDIPLQDLNDASGLYQLDHLYRFANYLLQLHRHRQMDNALKGT